LGRASPILLHLVPNENKAPSEYQIKQNDNKIQLLKEHPFELRLAFVEH